MYEVVSIRNSKGFIEEYSEIVTNDLKEAKEVAEDLWNDLTTQEQAYNNIEIRTDQNLYGYDTVEWR